MADRYRFRRPVRAAAVLGASVVGLTLGAPTAAATPDPAPTAPEAPVAVPEGVVDATTVDPATTSSSTSSSTSSTTSTSTTTTTTTVPTSPVTSGIIPPLVDSGQGVEIGEPATTGDPRSSRVRSRTASSGATLPLTGDSTVAVLGAGVGALAIGGLALWWGSRRRPEIDAPNPPATG